MFHHCLINCNDSFKKRSHPIHPSNQARPWKLFPANKRPTADDRLHEYTCTTLGRLNAKPSSSSSSAIDTLIVMLPVLVPWSDDEAILLLRNGGRNIPKVPDSRRTVYCRTQRAAVSNEWWKNEKISTWMVVPVFQSFFCILFFCKQPTRPVGISQRSIHPGSWGGLGKCGKVCNCVSDRRLHYSNWNTSGLRKRVEKLVFLVNPPRRK